jgi:hephaestin
LTEITYSFSLYIYFFNLQVVFRNNLKSVDKAVSVHPHGLAYNKSAEGAHYNDGTTGTDRLDDMVLPNTTISFTWQVPETAGPGPNDPSTIGWMYHSHSDEVADPLSGLVGMIVVGKPGSMQQSTLSSIGDNNNSTSNSNQLGTAKDVDREVFYLFSVMNERASFMWPVNLAAIEERDAALAESWLSSGGNVSTATTAAADPSPAGRKLLQEVVEAPATEEGADSSLMAMAEMEEVEGDLMHGINGYIYCNGPPLKLSRGENVRFHVMAVGTEVDMHSATLSDSNFNTHGQRSPTVGLLAGSMSTSDVAVVAPAGPAVLQCRVADHIEAGMQTLILVEEGSNPTSSSDNTTTTNVARVATSAAAAVPALDVIPTANATRRPYFIQAEESLWDYGPKGRNLCGSDGPVPFTDGENVFMEQYAGETIGSTYTKALYRRYVDKSFKQRFPVPIEHGILGPVIAAEVGDILEITFKNGLSFDVNLRIDAGLVPMQGSADVNAGVAPGESVTYILAVPESAGPGASDVNTVTYGYTSSVDLVYHPYSGLVGIALVGSPGAFAALNATAMPSEPVPAGVDKMLPLLIAVMNEGETVYLEKNAADAGVDLSTDGGSRRLQAAGEGEAEAAAAPGGSVDFEESNLMHAINGYMFCNMPEVRVETGKIIRVASLGMGSEVDIHSIVFSGQSLLGAPKGSPRGGLEPLMPASAMSVDLKAEQPGRWVYECLVHDHSEAGMRAVLKVDSAEETMALESSAVSNVASLYWMVSIAFFTIGIMQLLV